MNYTLHQLDIFIKVAECLSVTKAAEMLYLTQPAVSIQLKKFQEQFDTPLIEVINKRIHLTELGKEVLPIAKEIHLNQDRIEEVVNRSKGLLSGKLKISSVSTGHYVIPFLLRKFLDKHPKISLDISVDNKKTVLERLVNNSDDFAFVSVLPEDIEVESLELMWNQLNLIGCADAQYNTEHKIEQITSHYPLIYREEGSATRGIMENYFSDKPGSNDNKMELKSNESVKQAVLAGIGCSVMPIIGLKHELASGELKIIPRNDLPLYTSWYLVWLKGKKLSHASQAYLESLKLEKDELIKRYFSWCEEYYSL